MVNKDNILQLLRL